MESLLNLPQHGGPFKSGSFYVIRETSGVLLVKKKREALKTLFIYFLPYANISEVLYLLIVYHLLRNALCLSVAIQLLLCMDQTVNC